MTTRSSTPNRSRTMPTPLLLVATCRRLRGQLAELRGDAAPRERQTEAALAPRALAYLLAVGLVAAVLALLAVVSAPMPPPESLALAAALAVATASAAFAPLPQRSGSKLVLDTAALVAAVLLFDVRVALLVAAIGKGSALLLRRRPWDEWLFNVSVAVLQVAGGGAMLALLDWTPEALHDDATSAVLTALGVGVGMWFVSTALVAPMASLQGGEGLLRGWWSLVVGFDRRDLLLDLTQVGIGVVVAEFAVGHRWQVAALLVPIGALYQALAFHVGLRRRAEERLKHQAFHDALTGLPNRARFLDRLEQALAHPRQAGERLGLLFVDVDRFKFVNDSLGHIVGDELLKQLSRRLREAVRPGDLVGRFGGDEFTVLLASPVDVESSKQVAKRVIDALAAPFCIDGHETTVTASVGVALASPGSTSPEELLRDADIALYRAKRLGKARYAVYDADVDLDARQKVALEVDLRRAIGANELALEFQPQVDLATGRLVAVEALVRWHHPTRGLLTPHAFIPLAEETGLILPLGRWVLDEACRRGRSWLERFPHAPVVSVNLSARQFQDPGVVEDVSAALDASGLVPSRLKLEITESAMMANADDAATLDRLKALGVQIAIDDFGTGYASLDYLRRFPVDELKIDRAFVAGLGRHDGDLPIVRAVVGLAHAFGLSVVAEGIENGAQVSRLRALGCDLGQGFFFDRPLSADGVSRALAAGPVSRLPQEPVVLISAEPVHKVSRVG